MTKRQFLVVADTYDQPYGSQFHLFGIFPTREKAVDWLMEHPKVKFEDFYGDSSEFDFLWGWDGKEDKAEYLSMYFVVEFDGTPLYLGGYVE